MESYYVNTNSQANGDHEVHTSTCNHLPSIENRQYLGVFGNCEDAVQEAKKYFAQADGCYYCSKPCHKQ